MIAHGHVICTPHVRPKTSAVGVAASIIAVLQTKTISQFHFMDFEWVVVMFMHFVLPQKEHPITTRAFWEEKITRKPIS